MPKLIPNSPAQAALPRCHWVNGNNPDYVRYHDTEWGVPVHEDRKLFELLVLEAFQAGLSWECILMKREAFRKAFADFDPQAVAQFTPQDEDRLLQNPGIIRHRRKIHAAIVNARAFLAIQQDCGSFNAYIWGWTRGQSIVEQNLTESPLSRAVAKDLRKRGMKFLGSITVYAYLQAIGVILGHDPQCFLARHNTLACQPINANTAL